MVLKQVCDPHWFGTWCHVVLVYSYSVLLHFSKFQSIIQNLNKQNKTKQETLQIPILVLWPIFIALSFLASLSSLLQKYTSSFTDS